LFKNGTREPRLYRVGRSNGQWSSRPTGRSLAVVTPMFIFFTKRLGCGGSLLVSLLGTLLLLMLMRACSGGAGMW
jgi:hypothetical protein